jgi:hypothetical protein
MNIYVPFCVFLDFANIFGFIRTMTSVPVLTHTWSTYRRFFSHICHSNFNYISSFGEISKYYIVVRNLSFTSILFSLSFSFLSNKNPCLYAREIS